MIALDRLQQIIPSDQALANKALSAGLEQIGGVSKMSLPTLAATVTAIQPLSDLPLVNAQTTAVPPDIANFYSNLAVGGSGPGNIVIVSDIIGTAAGYNYTQELTDTLTQFGTMNLTYLTLIYQTMLNVVNGVYGTSPVVIPAGTPGAGTYANEDTAVSTGLIPVAQTEIATLVSTYPNQVTQLNKDWSTMGDQWLTEQRLQSQAGINFANLQSNSQSSIFSFITNLPSYGQNSAVGESNWYLTSVANVSNFYGQSVVACLQQGSNQVSLQNSGILTTYNIPE